MDYVALGHWHGFGAVGKYENVYYSGSSERTSLNDKRNSKGFILATLEESLTIEYKEINIRAIRQKEIDCEDYETSIQNLDVSDCLDAIVEVKLKNLTPLSSIDIQNKQIKDIFPSAMSVSIKREFKKSDSNSDIQNLEAISLEEYFLEHIKEESEDKEYERLKSKVQELFSKYEELSYDTN
jgi:DNA repair exonuclease SbcCD nuclease subunit